MIDRKEKEQESAEAISGLKKRVRNDWKFFELLNKEEGW